MTQFCKPVLGIILKGYPRISETFISNEILLLEQQGFRVHLFSMRQPRENFCHASVKQIRAAVDYLPETLLRPLPTFLYHNLRLALRSPTSYARAFKTALHRLRRTRKTATIKHLLQAGYLAEHLLPASGVTHLHAHFAHSPTSVAMFASQLSGLPFSFTAHAKDIYTSHPEQLREKIAAARFVTTCTDYNRRHLKETARKVDTPIHRIYHGIDIALFNGTPPRKAPAAPYRLITVARLTAKKGLSTVYRALRILCDRGIELRHTLIGDGEDRDDILRLITNLGLDPVASWLGTQPHEVVRAQYRQSDLFVLGCEVAKNGDRDGIPNVFLECMAMGLPVVATDISAIPELIEDRETGLLVAPGDPEMMAHAIQSLLTDIHLRRRIITNAKRRVVAEFDNQKLIRDLAALYRSQGL